MNNKEAKELLDKYFAGECTPEERLLVERAYNLQDNQYTQFISEEKYEEIKAQVWGNLDLGSSEVKKSYRLWPHISVAAAAIATIVFGVYFFNAARHDDSGLLTEFGARSQDVAPGKNGATITLANGKVIQLSDAKTGVVVGGMHLKYDDGSQVPVSSLTESKGGVQNLTASTARGQTYQFTLPDGTKVWLNADSKISFPTQFNGRVRKILLTGEGYFEVRKDKEHPFIVESRGQEVEVLGTHFNLAAYLDESLTKTTLLEGKVKILNRLKDSLQETILNPGQQMLLSKSESHLILNPDLEEITAWKDGYFKFSESLESIMAKVARWYNVEIIYQDNFNGKLKFLGKISRTKNLSAILDIIESAGNVHFKIEGRRVTVMK
ncbi:MAG TPA: FecR domain-containing protein [Pedobacter sp.]|uniref:FecR family protein n=1 Tax=Pedobacter sp. TaxID=1411316 RepID=UPI002B91241C|nr:FecR domain-containing protein [Pedobacter sp.]HMI03988.1 FecR domain-containing protein [Pedobacter sp.]